MLAEYADELQIVRRDLDPRTMADFAEFPVIVKELATTREHSPFRDKADDLNLTWSHHAADEGDIFFIHSSHPAARCAGLTTRSVSMTKNGS